MANLAEVLPGADERVKPGSSSARVLDYLRTMERRELPKALAMQAPGFRMQFPGGQDFTTLEQLFAYGAPRQKSARKIFEGFDETTDGRVVFAFGTLYGERVDGTPFRDVRFVDRFALAPDGRFTDQTVYNDMGVEGFGPGTHPIAPPPPGVCNDASAEGTASRTVLKYLRAMEQGRYDEAKAMFAPGFWMLFPGNARFTTVEEVLAGMAKRGTYAIKTFYRFDECPTDQGIAVFAQGTVAATLNNGSAYKDVRFVDRITVRDGKLVDQRVWNDRGEHKESSGR